MTPRVGIVAALLAAVFLVRPAYGLIEKIFTLKEVVDQSKVIVEGEIVKVDSKGRTAVVRVTRTIKGKCVYKQIKMNISIGQKWHPKVLAQFLKVGSPMLIFYTNPSKKHGIPCLLYVNGIWFQLFGDPKPSPDKAWWRFTHIELLMNRTFDGSTEDLKNIVRKMVAGKSNGPRPNPRRKAFTRKSLQALAARIPDRPTAESAAPAAKTAVAAAEPKAGEAQAARTEGRRRTRARRSRRVRKPSVRVQHKTTESVCRSWLAMARNYLRAGRRREARTYLKKVIDKCSHKSDDSWDDEAESAHIREARALLK